VGRPMSDARCVASGITPFEPNTIAFNPLLDYELGDIRKHDEHGCSPPRQMQGSWVVGTIIIESYFKSCRVFPLWKSPTQAGGKCDPATNDQFVKLTPLGLTGAVASREEPPSIG
jgi:hypothetical protein